MFGKSVPMLAILMIGMLTIGASASLLSYYGYVVTTAKVEQSVFLDDKPYTVGVTDSPTVKGGDTVCVSHYIRNLASVDAKVQLVVIGAEAGISVSFCNTLRLEDKNPDNWALLSTPDKYADVEYKVIGDKFAYTIDAKGLTPDTEYTLIYYQDEAARFVNWGELVFKLGTCRSDALGVIHGSGLKETNGDLPRALDWNDSPEADYSKTPDFYDHMRGAKLWLVPSADLESGVYGDLKVWNPTTYLFETDMIRYFDNTVNKLIIPAGEYLRFDFCYTFDIALTPGTYDIEIDVIPVVLAP